MKFILGVTGTSEPSSHPTRGAWIEILVDFDRVNVVLSRTPPGVRGLKYAVQENLVDVVVVAPHPGCVD